ncbi:MAG: D-alanyl-D-alanine carboxypeptidase/D-alanyl-D-alanine endopeptidase [Ilumatobacteraceae bacterium]
MTEPTRGRLHPVVVLTLIALLPMAMLVGLRSLLPEESVATPVDLTPSPSIESYEIASRNVMSFRRAAPELSGRSNRTELIASLQSVTSQMAPTSCLSLSVDGVPLPLSSDTAAIPASTVKILVASAAIDVLGADYTFTTRVVGSAPVDGVVNGDIVLIGGGDPLLSGDWYPNSNLDRYPVFGHTSLDELATSLSANGVTSVAGRVLGDGSRYDDEWYYDEWGAGVAGIEAGPIDALMANDARIEGDDYRASDPAAGAAREFIQRLNSAGIQVSGGSGVGLPPDDAIELATVTSSPLSVVITEMLQNSDNNTAEMLVKEIGLHSNGNGSRQDGLAAIQESLSSQGVDLTDLRLVDGSGLSNTSVLRCQTLVDTLAAADRAVIDGLAVAGVSGTLSSIFTEGPMTGALKAKTGTLGNLPYDEDPPAVKALAGEYVARGGETLSFALVLNQSMINDQANYRPIWDALASTMAQYPTGPTASEMSP